MNTATAQKEPANERTIHDVARDCMVSAKGDRDAAVTKYLARLRADKALFASLVWSLVALAVRRVVGGADTISKDTLRRIDGRGPLRLPDRTRREGRPGSAGDSAG